LNYIPDSEVLIPDGDGELGRLTLLDHYLFESTEDFRRFVCVFGETEVDLSDFCTIVGTCVTDCEGNIDSIVV
jgi:hypothetical protein